MSTALQTAALTIEDSATYYNLVTAGDTRTLEAATVAATVYADAFAQSQKISGNIAMLSFGDLTVADMVKNRIFANVGDLSIDAVY